MPRTFDLFAACLPGFEPLLAGELAALGTEPRPLRGGVAFTGDHRLLMRTCLQLGTASHVMLRLAEFPCRALGELQRKAAVLPWGEWLRPQVPLEVRATTRGSRVYHTGAVVERIENAIATALGTTLHAPAEGDEVVARVRVRFQDDRCTISLDATTTPLHRRGYRLEGAKAPLREDIAHALVLASGWTPDQALLDPFCGSGTIAIEAASLALGLAPGRLRPPPLHHLALFAPDEWLEIQAEPRAGRGDGAISASDRDEGAVTAARHNAERAGVADRITFATQAFTAHPWLAQRGADSTAPERGVLATNPPFGVRVPRADKLDSLYQTIGHRAARLGAGWRCALLANDVRLARRSALQLRAAWTTRHGGLSVTCLVGDAASTAAS
jgi:putative N6-adenine-specific DNA methylase